MLTLPTKYSDLCRVFAQIERSFVWVVPTDPVALPPFLSTALPAATINRAKLIYVTDINTVAFSDGAFWYPLTKGPHL